MSTPSLLDAIRVVKENERLAMTSYSDAVDKVKNQVGKQLFAHLAEFEKYHFDRLTALENSLEAGGEYIDYEGKEFPLPPVFEIKAAQEAGAKSVMSIITAALALEEEAEKAYADLSARIEDPKGSAMFQQLSREEHIHWVILNEAFWSLNDQGTWKWSRPS